MSSKVEFSKWWWNDENSQNKVSASEEALRKYYSVKEYVTHGTPRVCTAPYIVDLDKKFGDQKDNLWLHHTSKPLEDTITRYSIKPDNKEMKIVTSLEKKQPRLLLVSVDVALGKTEIFDSYHEKVEDPRNSLYPSEGITIDHIMASGTIPEFYDFRVIGERQFCDGGLLSNTPFRELLQAHQEYWLKVTKDRVEQKVPNLEVYLINNHPSKGSIIEDNNYDGVKDRTNDIIYHDRNSHYDENVVNTFTDYVAIIDKLKHLARSYVTSDKLNEIKKDFEQFLKTEAKSKSHNEGDRLYGDVLDSKFELTKVVRIENGDYKDSISGKGADFTSKSIKDLIALGYSDALKVLNIK